MDSYQDLTVGFSLQESPWSECVSKCHAYIMCRLLNIICINMSCIYLDKWFVHASCHIPTELCFFLILSMSIFWSPPTSFFWYIFASYMLVIEILQIIHQKHPCSTCYPCHKWHGKMPCRTAQNFPRRELPFWWLLGRATWKTLLGKLHK